MSMRSRTTNLKLRRLALACILALLASGCDALKDPIEPWQVDVTYEQRGNRVVAVPNVLTVDGPFGFVSVTNDTPREHGFAIRELAVFEKILPDATLRVRVEEARDGKTYVFEDQLHDGEMQGRLVVRYKKEEER